MDLVAFAKFCETSSIARCRAVGGQQSPRWVGRITVDADNNKIMLEAVEQRMRNQELILDLHKAAQAGQVDEAFMSACVNERNHLEAIVIRNSETWTGHADCLNKPVELFPDKARQLEMGLRASANRRWPAETFRASYRNRGPLTCGFVSACHVREQTS